MYRVFILKKAQADLDWFRKNDRQGYLKCFDLVRELMFNPRQGTGKPERLKYFEKEVYSRRINHKDRLIYTVYEDLKEVDVSSAIPGGASKINSPSGMRVKMQQLLPSERPERQLETLRQPEFGLNPLLVAHERQQIVIAAGWRP